MWLFAVWFSETAFPTPEVRVPDISRLRVISWKPLGKNVDKVHAQARSEGHIMYIEQNMSHY